MHLFDETLDFVEEMEEYYGVKTYTTMAKGVQGDRIRAYRRWNYAKDKGLTDRYKWRYEEDYELYIKGFFD